MDRANAHTLELRSTDRKGNVGSGTSWRSTSSTSRPRVGGGAGGAVPATLSLTFGSRGGFGAFTPGVAREYDATTSANVISTAGDAR